MLRPGECIVKRKRVVHVRQPEKMPAQHDPANSRIERSILLLCLIEHQLVIKHAGITVFPNGDAIALMTNSRAVVCLEVHKHADPFVGCSPITSPQGADLIQLQCFLVHGAHQRCGQLCF
jgi:hypothetical protein